MRSILSAAGFSLACATAGAQTLDWRDQDGMRWVCGGVGTTERAALARLEPQANLKLLFVTAKRGGYLADAALALRAEGETAARLKVNAEGPICLIRAPAGRYRLDASIGEVKRSATVAIAAESREPARVVFSFPGKPWDGIWASDEEKAQARTP